MFRRKLSSLSRAAELLCHSSNQARPSGEEKQIERLFRLSSHPALTQRERESQFRYFCRIPWPRMCSNSNAFGIPSSVAGLNPNGPPSVFDANSIRSPNAYAYASVGCMLAYAYAFGDRIEFASNTEGGPFGLSPATLLGMPNAFELEHILGQGMRQK